MKSETTIRKMEAQLHKFYLTHNDMPHLAAPANEAHAMAAALQWVFEDCDWTPLSRVKVWAQTLTQMTAGGKQAR